ncbi:MAG: hypothetical protein HZB43_07420 [candidate division Zixibacteria bacterium]|nr:hypothetical protein [candidate division Zixibacteria bacterium]
MRTPGGSSSRWINTVLCCIAILLPVRVAWPQSSANPDFSLIGDIRAFTHNDPLRPRENKKFNLDLHEAELAINGYLNPFARADAFFSWADGENAAVEELYFTATRGLPFGITLKAGQYLVGFGNLNVLHPHAYSFIERPLAQQAFLGEDGLKDIGISASVALPTGNVSTTATVDVLKGDFLDDAGFSAPPRPNDPAFAARAASFFSLGDFTSLQLGISGLTGVPIPDGRRWIGGIDGKFKWKPDRYRSLVVQAEWMVNREPAMMLMQTGSGAAAATAFPQISAKGGFAFVDYQFHQRYNTGALVDWTEEPQDSHATRWRMGGFVGFAPVEETSLLRFLIAYTRDRQQPRGFWSATTQLIFSLGPHKPHPF